MKRGIVTLKNGEFYLKYNYTYKTRCNCHPETCCCGGYDHCTGTHELLVINQEGLIDGNEYCFELKSIICNNGKNAYREDRVYILDKV